MPKTVTLLVPVLNEVEGMKAVMPKVPKELFTQILVVDGKSTDGSAEWARQNGFEVYVQKAPGIRNAYIEVWPQIRGHYVITFSPDHNSKPEDLPLIVSKLQEDAYDMVIASRYLGGATSEDDTWLTGFGNWMFTRLINLVHGGRYTDAMGIYRGYPKTLFYDLDLDKQESYDTDKVFKTISGIEPLISIRAAKKRLRIVEVPSAEPKRISGVKKMQPFKWGASFLLMIFREIYYWPVAR